MQYFKQIPISQKFTNILIRLHKRLHNVPSLWRFSQDTSLCFFLKQLAVSVIEFFWKHARFAICLLVLIVGELRNISNKSQLPNRSAEYLLFYTKELTYLLHFQGKWAPSIGEVSWNIHILLLFHWFWEWVRCLILQMNTSFLISQLKTYIFTQETLRISFTYLHIGVFRTQSNT